MKFTSSTCGKSIPGKSIYSNRNNFSAVCAPSTTFFLGCTILSRGLEMDTNLDKITFPGKLLSLDISNN